MVCGDQEETGRIEEEFSKVESGCLQVYTKIVDLMNNLPTGRVVSVIVATTDGPSIMGQALSWIRHRWPRCSITVIGDVGCNGLEMAARRNSANFLTRPVTTEEWTAILTQHSRQRQTLGRRERPPVRAFPLR
jgi:hypothetical protein